MSLDRRRVVPLRTMRQDLIRFLSAHCDDKNDKGGYALSDQAAADVGDAMLKQLWQGGSVGSAMEGQSGPLASLWGCQGW
jgi:hypothetical protein